MLKPADNSPAITQSSPPKELSELPENQKRGVVSQAMQDWAVFWEFAWQEFQRTKGYRWMRKLGVFLNFVLLSVLGLSLVAITQRLWPIFPSPIWFAILFGVIVLVQGHFFFWGRYHQRKVGEFENEKATLNGQCFELARINQELRQIEWMRIIADADAKNIERMIFTRSPSIRYDFSNPSSPWIEFAFFMNNGTFYPIAINPDIRGFMTYGGSPIEGKIIQRSNAEIKKLERGMTAVLRFRLWLKSEDVETTWRKVFETQDLNPSKRFEFNDLVITVKGAEPFVDRVKPQRLVLNFTGVDTNQRNLPDLP